MEIIIVVIVIIYNNNNCKKNWNKIPKRHLMKNQKKIGNPPGIQE